MQKENLLIKMVRKSEWLSCLFIKVWIVLPAIMSIIIFVYGSLHKFPDEADLKIFGLSFGGVYHQLTLNTYTSLFDYIGFITILYALFYIFISGKRIFKKENLKNKPWFFLLLGLLCWSTISACLSDNRDISFFGENYMHDGLYSYFVYAAIFIIASTINNEKWRKNLILFYLLVITYLGVLLFVQHFNIPFINYCYPSNNATVFNQFNHMGYMLCVTGIGYLAFYLFDNYKKRYLIGFGFILYILLINNTFGSFLGLIAGLIFTYIIYHARKNKISIHSVLPIFILIVVCLCTTVGIFPFGQDSLLVNLTTLSSDLSKIANKEDGYLSAGTGRFTLWKDTIEKGVQRPIFGYGPTGLVLENAITNNDSPHNEYLQIAAYLGIPALLFYLSSLFSLSKHHIQHLKELSLTFLVVSCCAAAYCASAFFGNPVYNTAPYFWMFFGLCACSYIKQDNLLLPIEEDLNQTNSNIRVKKLIPIIIAAALVAIVSITILQSNKHKFEAECERADIEIMKIAYNLAQLNYKNGTIDVGDYWYDNQKFSLIPCNNNKPNAYGIGTAINANYIDEYNNVNNSSFIYDGSIDYSDKVIKTTLSLDQNSQLIIEISWE